MSEIRRTCFTVVVVIGIFGWIANLAKLLTMTHTMTDAELGVRVVAALTILPGMIAGYI